MFYVIEFNDNSCEVVPEKWISSDGSFCYWPDLKSTALEQAIRSEKHPEQRWRKVDIKRIMRKCATYEIANRKANKALSTSDLETSSVTDQEMEISHNLTKRTKRPPVSYSPELITPKVCSQSKSTTVKSQAPTALHNLPEIPAGLIFYKPPDKSSILSASRSSATSPVSQSRPISSESLSAIQNRETASAAMQNWETTSAIQNRETQSASQSRPSVSASQSKPSASASKSKPSASASQSRPSASASQSKPSASVGQSRLSASASQSTSAIQSRPSAFQTKTISISDLQSILQTNPDIEDEHDLQSLPSDRYQDSVMSDRDESIGTSNVTLSPGLSLVSPSLSRSSRMTSHSGTGNISIRRQEYLLLVSKMNRMDEKLDSLSRKVTMILNRGGAGAGGNADVPAVPDGMQLLANTAKDLKTVSSIVKHNARSSKNLARYLSTFCSTTVTNSVNSMMKALMTNALALQYNWTGSKEKHSFMTLDISPVICDAVRMNEASSTTVNKIIEDKIKIWLRLAHDRDGGRKRRFLASVAKASAPGFDLLTDREEDSVESDE